MGEYRDMIGGPSNNRDIEFAFHLYTYLYG